MKRFGLYALMTIWILSLGCAAESDPVRLIDAASEPTADAPAFSAAPATLAPLSEAVTVTLAPTEAPSTPIPTPTPTEAPTATPSPVPTATPSPVPTPTPAITPEPDAEQVETFLAAARAMEGRPYKLGGKTEDGFDPGGFVYYCLNKAGYKVSHRSSKGYSELTDWTKIDKLSELEPGDILFFMTGSNESVNCACIYLGDGQMIYPSSGKGEVIITKVRSSYWESAFVFARRVF